MTIAARPGTPNFRWPVCEMTRNDALLRRDEEKTKTQHFCLVAQNCHS